MLGNTRVMREEIRDRADGAASNRNQNEPRRSQVVVIAAEAMQHQESGYVAAISQIVHCDC